MKRSKRIVLEAPDGYTFGVSEEDSGELKIKLIPTVATEYSGNYTDPPIPEGWEYVEGDWNNGFTKKRRNYMESRPYSIQRNGYSDCSS